MEEVTVVRTGTFRETALGSKPFRDVGRGARIRTADLLRPRQARYQAAPRPELNTSIILPSLRPAVQFDSASRRLHACQFVDEMKHSHSDPDL